MSDMRDRLRRQRDLRTHFTGTVAPFRLPGEPQPIEALARGYDHETDLGLSYIIPTLHAPDQRHGGYLLNDWLGQDLTAAAEFIRDPRLSAVDPRRCLFLDTETTGLASSAGTLVFLVGVGFFTDQGFEVRQYFLRDPSEEPAMLRAIHNLLKEHDALVTFNGRSFDVPLLESRYTLNRQRVSLAAWSNLDLLHPARRLWKRRLELCRLSNLEVEVLGVERTSDDVPGFLIPQMYQDYVRTHDARDIMRVIYHNLIDVLSMVTLGVQVCETFARPATKRLPGKDMLSLARWYESLNRLPEADAAYEQALTGARLDSEMVDVLQSYTALLKKQGRSSEAAVHWETWATLQPKAIDPRIELAKYHEWDAKDPAQAILWTEAALAAARSWGMSFHRETTIAELEHRLERLRNKT